MIASALLATLVSVSCVPPEFITQKGVFPEVPEPIWWGGAVGNLEEGLALAGDWCREVSLGGGGGGGVSRAWQVSGAGWTIGAAVRADSERITERQRWQQDLRSQATLRALQAHAVGQLNHPLSRFVVEAANLGFGGSELRATLRSGVHTRGYAEAGRLFTICLLPSESIRSCEVTGLDEPGLAALAATGMLSQAQAESWGGKGFIEQVLELDSTPLTLELAARTVTRVGDGEAAEPVWAASTGIPLSLDPGVLGVWAALGELAGKPESLPCRLAALGEEEQRLALIERTLRDQGLTGLTVLIAAREGFMGVAASREVLDNERSRRDTVQDLLAPAGGPRISGLGMDLHGHLIQLQGAQTDPTWNLDIIGDCLVFRKGTVPDARLWPRGGRVRVTLSAEASPAEVAARAVLQRTVDLGLWAELAAGVLTQAVAEELGARNVQWSVPLGAGAWELDLATALDQELTMVSSTGPFTFWIGPGEAPAHTVVDTLASGLIAEGGVLAARDSAEALVSWSTEIGQAETGSEPGSLLGGERTWSRVPVTLEVTMSMNGQKRALMSSTTTRRVFGGASMLPAIGEASAELATQLARDLIDVVGEERRRPGPVTIAGTDGELLNRMVSLAGQFGRTERLAGDDHATHTGALYTVFWPGGVSGLSRTLQRLTLLDAWEEAQDRIVINGVGDSDEL